MAGWEDLESLGVFSFSGARREVDAIFEPIEAAGTGTDDEIEAIRFTRDLVLLGAASVHIAGQMASPHIEPVGSHLEVGAPDARISFLKYDCAGTYIHGRLEPAEVNLSDVVVFTGDVAKLMFLGVRSVNEFADGFEEIFGRLEQAYAASVSPLAQTVAESGWFHLEGLVWRATLAHVVRPDRMASDLGSFVDRFGAHLRLPHLA